MKQLLLILLMISFTYSNAQESILKLKGNQYNDILSQMVECDLEFGYDVKEDKLYFMINETLTLSVFLFTRENRDSVNTMINKYFAWEKKAVDMQVKIEKEIAKRKTSGALFTYDGSEYHGSPKGSFSGLFFSQTKDRHQLVLQFVKIQDRNNQFIDHKVESIYLDKDDVIEFQKAFKQEFIASAIKKIEEKDNIENQFK